MNQIDNQQKIDILLEIVSILIKENFELKQRNRQLEEVCKMHIRAVDFYIKKLDEAEKQLRNRKEV